MTRGIQTSLRIAAFTILGLLAACRRAEVPAGDAAAKGSPTVYTASYPLAYFAERLGGGIFTVVFPMAEDGDPAFWQPAPPVIAAYQKADLILLNGAGYSAWAAKASLPASRTVDTSAGFGDLFISIPGTVTHNHGPQGAHTHAALAFTTWLDPRLAMRQAGVVAEALTRLRPSDAAAIAGRLAVLNADWMALERALKEATAGHRERPVIASHPVYQYLERAAGLDWRSLHWEPDAEPDAAQWEELRALLEKHPARAMVWEGEPLPSVRARLENEFGLRVVVFNPCGNRPAAGDLLSVMQAGIAALAEVYR